MKTIDTIILMFGFIGITFLCWGCWWAFSHNMPIVMALTLFGVMSFVGPYVGFLYMVGEDRHWW